MAGAYSEAMDDRKELAKKIREHCDKLREIEGWSVDDLASYCEINSQTLRNALYRGKWSDLVVTILKLKHVIPEDLAYSYRKNLQREKIERRKTAGKKEAFHDPNENNTRRVR